MQSNTESKDSPPLAGMSLTRKVTAGVHWQRVIIPNADRAREGVQVSEPGQVGTLGNGRASLEKRLCDPAPGPCGPWAKWDQNVKIFKRSQMSQFL